MSFIILSLMGNLRGLFKPWRTCFVLAFLTLVVTGMRTYSLWNLPIIIVTRLVLSQHHMKLYMGNLVDCPCAR